MYVKIFCNFYNITRSLRCYSYNSSQKLLEFLATMPKVNSDRIAEAQRQRLNIQKRSEKYSPSTIYLQVLGSGAHGAPVSLYMFTDQKRYLFNCGEGTQRVAYEHKVRLSRLDDIFITRKAWRNIGGLPGLSLTLQDVGVPRLTLHGPEGLDKLYNATKRFIVMKDMEITMAECSPTEDFEDHCMTVKYVFLAPNDDASQSLDHVAKKPKLDSNINNEYKEFINDDTDYYKKENAQSTQHKENALKMDGKGNENKFGQKLKMKSHKADTQRKNNYSVAYICKIKKRLGSLKLERCVELGVKPGPLLGKLKNGEDVVLPDGKIVQSKDVKTPDDPGPIFIVLDVPDITYLKESEFKNHFDDGVNSPDNIPTLLVHFTPTVVFNESRYQSFMAMFGPNTQHLVLNESNSCLGSEAVHRTQHKLHLLDSDIFPLLKDVSIPATWDPSPPLQPETDEPNQPKSKEMEDLKNELALAHIEEINTMKESCEDESCEENEVVDEQQSKKLQLIAGKTLTMFHLRPKSILDRSPELKLHIRDYIQEPIDNEGFAESLGEFKKTVDGIRQIHTLEIAQEYPKVVFLGTGSSVPSKTRNTSAILVQVSENKSMILDCGEGTYGQLVRFFGPQSVNEFLRTLQAVYISHLHADHHIGLIGVLQARRRAWEECKQEILSAQPLLLLAPGQIISWLSLYDQQFERICDDFTLIPNQNLLPANCSDDVMTAATLARLGLEQVEMCLVSHCPNAFGVALTIDERHKVTYSGDTIPCEELVRIGKNSTLLIHEATMEDELEAEARVKMHSTTSQAIDIGRQMGAHYTVLTHFSQRYARIPRITSSVFEENSKVGIAFDNMQIKMSDLELLPRMYTPLKFMFAEHCADMDTKAAQRARRKERNLSKTRSISPATVTHETSLEHTCREPAQQPLYKESRTSRLRMQMKNKVMTSSEDEQSSKSISPLLKISNNTLILAPIQSKIPTPKCTATSLVENSKIIPRPRSGTAAVYYSLGDCSSGSYALSVKPDPQSKSRSDSPKSTVHPSRLLTSQCSNRLSSSRSVKQMFECISPVTTNRPFKSQIDDLKSSNLLVDKSQQPDRHADKKDKGQNDNKINKAPMNAHLHQVKKKFQSKKYWHESKYDKIEGLNWISWG